MGQDDDTYKAVVLGNDNFEAWSKDLKSSALIKDVWEFINPPGVSLAPTATSEERLEWKRNSNKALGLLIKSVDKTDYDRVERIESACDAFKKLSKHHLGASAGNHFNLFAQMVDIHFDPEEPLEALSSRSVDIMNKFKASIPAGTTAAQIPDRLQVVSQVRALQVHPEFAPLVSALLLQPSITHDQLESAFRSFQLQRAHATNVKAMAALQFKSKLPDADKVKDEQCPVHPNMKHTLRNCFVLQEVFTGKRDTPAASTSKTQPH